MVQETEPGYARSAVRPFIRIQLCRVVFTGALLTACGGTPPSPAPPSSREHDEEVIAIVMTPTDAERQGGGLEVVIDASDAVHDWVSSAAFAPSGWQTNEDKSAPRYVVSFRGRDGEVARYFMGTMKGQPLAYRCFGLCETWWAAPAQADGTQDPLRYRVLADEVWHPLARQWYLSSK